MVAILSDYSIFNFMGNQFHKIESCAYDIKVYLLSFTKEWLSHLHLLSRQA
jgi:hypothetical protein